MKPQDNWNTKETLREYFVILSKYMDKWMLNTEYNSAN